MYHEAFIIFDELGCTFDVDDVESWIEDAYACKVKLFGVFPDFELVCWVGEVFDPV
jgi:hypothetical protein